MLTARRGNTLVEVVIALGLLVVLTVGITASLTTSNRASAAVMRKTMAKEIATETIDEYLAQNPDDIQTSDPSTLVVWRAGMAFDVTRAVTISAYTPRVIVTVTSKDGEVDRRQTITLTKTIPRWGNR